MKKNRLILIVAAGLIAATAFFMLRDNSGTVRKEDRNFGVTDTASVMKIFLADRSGHSVTLERRGAGAWVVDQKSEARQQGINLLLECFCKIRVQTRVPKTAFNTVVKELSSTGIKCEIYTKDPATPFKVYYVGGSTQDVQGTYMMLDQSTVPFVTEIPGFTGYLTPRYSAVPRDWMVSSLVKLKPGEIQSIRIEYFNQPQKSFAIERNGNSYKVFSPSTGKAIAHIDTLHITSYLANFNPLNFETWDRYLKDNQIDSLRNAAPATLITITDVQGHTTQIPIYPKPVTEASLAQQDASGKPLKYDMDRLYAFRNDKKELVTIQFHIFNKVFGSLEDFDLDVSKQRAPR